MFARTALRLATRRVDAGFDADHPLLFIHIFKTGGSTLRNQIELACGLRDTQGVYERIGSLTARVKRYLPEAELRNTGASLYYGHMFYGIHQRLGVSPTYATFLRDPVERALSHHQHLNRVSAERGERAESLLRSMDRREIQLDNLQTRFTSGFRDVPFGEMTSHHVDVAKRNLAGFAFVGLLEDLASSIERLNALLGTDIAAVKTINASGPSWSVDSYSPAELEAVTEINRLDAELYRFAEDRIVNAV